MESLGSALDELRRRRDALNQAIETLEGLDA